jgi:hypothetical protein
MEKEISGEEALMQGCEMDYKNKQEQIRNGDQIQINLTAEMKPKIPADCGCLKTKATHNRGTIKFQEGQSNHLKASGGANKIDDPSFSNSSKTKNKFF